MNEPLDTSRLSSLSQKLPIVAIDSQGAVTKINSQARKVLAGANADEGADLGKLVAGLFKNHDSTNAIASLSLTSNDGQPPDRLVVVLSEERADERPPPEHAVTDDAPRQSTDTSDRRLADFLAHELRNPLGSIQSWAKILRGRIQTLSQVDRAEALQYIEGDAERALLIVDGLLRIARLRRTDEQTRIPLHAVLRSVASNHGRQNPERHLILSGDSPVYVKGDSMGVELALGNLLRNAEKYAPKSTSIRIACHQEGNRVTVFVSNEGASLRTDLYPGLWEAYSRTPDAATVISGSGIGLALCKELIERMGGRVWAGPRERGGSVFAITLQVAESSIAGRPQLRLLQMESKAV